MQEILISLLVFMDRFYNLKKIMENNFESVFTLDQLPKGFYVNVTTNNSAENPVLKILYEKGWRGINIHPDLEFLNRIETDRPEDINVNAFITDNNGYIEVAKNLIPCRSLDIVLDECEVEEIHFLRISVNRNEEKKVIEGLFLTDLSPHVLMIEANTDTVSKDFLDCENLILEKGYETISLSEKNKVYLAKKYEDLRHDFQKIFCLASKSECKNKEQMPVQIDEDLKEHNKYHQKLEQRKLFLFELMCKCLKKMRFKKSKNKELNVNMNICSSLHCENEKSKAEELLEYYLYDQLSGHYSKIRNQS